MRLALLGACLIATACTQDFDQFEPDGADAASGGATSLSSSSATSVGATGGEGGHSSSVSSGGATSSSGGGSGEDCEDAVDNDGDTMVDCADADCASFECAAAVPSGWSGYYRLHEVPYPNPAPSPCPDASAPGTYFRDPASAACAACTCGAWAGATCSAPGLTCWLSSGTCQGGSDIDLTQFVENGTCYDVPNISGTTQRSCRLTEPAMVTASGACPPAGGALTNPNPWLTQSDACAQPPAGGGGCRGGGVCIPKGSGDYAGPACIYADGVQACPAGFGTTLVAYASGTDNRSCTGCQCNVQGAACNNGSYTVYELDACAGTSTAVSSSACVNVSAQLDTDSGSIDLVPATAVGGSCVAGGGVPTGAVVPAGPITICCP